MDTSVGSVDPRAEFGRMENPLPATTIARMDGTPVASLPMGGSFRLNIRPSFSLKAGATPSDKVISVSPNSSVGSMERFGDSGCSPPLGAKENAYVFGIMGGLAGALVGGVVSAIIWTF